MNRKAIIAIVVLIILGVAGYFGYTMLIAEPELSEDISSVSDTIDDAESGVVYRIDPTQSEASFTLQEDLRGERIDVVGATNQVGADIVLDFDNPQNSDMSTVTINARAIATDSTMRDSQIRSRILQSNQDEYEFITFSPTELLGLPDTAEVGQTYTFQIVGDLTIIETTNSVTFDAEVTIDSADQISGTATTNIVYGDFGVTVFSPPFVANITDDADLTIDFVALAVDEDAVDTTTDTEEGVEDAPEVDATEETE